MKVYWVECSSKLQIKPMVIVGDLEKFLNHMLVTSDAFKGLTRENFVIEEKDIIRLDPGGMCRTEPESIDFKIETINFNIDWDQISGVLSCLDYADERMEGYRRSPQWRWNLVLPKELHENLKKELAALSMKDKALHAFLDREAAREQAEKEGITIRFDKLAQLPPEEARKKLEDLGILPPREEKEEKDPSDWWKEQ